jgi:uncharacterized protein YjbI with pentapeptide repeats
MDKTEKNLQEQIALLLRHYTDQQQVYGLELDGALLASINFETLHGENLRFCDADLSTAILHRVRLISCDFSAASLHKADLSKATLRSCVLNNVRAAKARCEGVCFEHSILHGADFARAHLVGARLTGSSWARAYLPQVVLDGAKGGAVVFRGADLMDASLVGAQLPAADFRGADLSGADLSDGDFSAADFRGAILDEVRWLGAVYKGTRFDHDRPDPKTRPSAAANVTEPEQNDFADTPDEGARQTRYANSDAASIVMNQLISLISAGGVQTGRATRNRHSDPAQTGEDTLTMKNTADLLMSLERVPKRGNPAKAPKYPAGATLSATLKELFPDITEPNEAALETLVSTMITVLDKSKKVRETHDDNNIPEKVKEKKSS